MANVIILGEYLEVNSVPIATPGFFTQTLEALEDGPPVRDDNTVIPGSPGTYPNQHTKTERIISLPVHILGYKNREGTPYSNPRLGRSLNKDYLLANLGLGKDSGDGTVVAVWHRRDGSTKTTNVTVLDLGNTVRRAPTWDICRLDLAVPLWFA